MSEHLTRHLTGDELIQRLYGMDTGASHLKGCSECGARYQALEAKRAEMAVPEGVPADVLAAQRRAIYSRMGEKPSSHAWIPALATAALLALGVYVYQPVTTHHGQKIIAGKIIAAPKADVGDAQLFSEAVSMELTAEPRAVEPIHGLFEENQ